MGKFAGSILDGARVSAADRAFSAPLEDEFFGEVLGPFTVRRQFAAQALGNRLFCGTAEFTAAGVYEGLSVDVAVHLYLRRAPDAECLAAVLEPAAVLERVLVWAEDVGLGLGSAQMARGAEIYWGAIGDLQASLPPGAGEEDGGPGKI